MNNTQYLLTCLMEECAEVAQRASKAIRFGLAEVQPGQELTNRVRLERELADILVVAGMLGLQPDEATLATKPERIAKYSEYSRSLGILE